jgi:hypothetical protein
MAAKSVSETLNSLERLLVKERTYEHQVLKIDSKGGQNVPYLKLNQLRWKV